MNLKFISGVIIGIVLGVVLTATVVVNAGNLMYPSSSPVDTESYTLADIYHSLNSGQAAEASTFTEPEVEPGEPTMYTLDEIYELTRERAPVGKTGIMTKKFDGDDGDIQAGVNWPVPRFTDNVDGTVTDNLTGLIWLKDANCLGAPTLDSAFLNVRNLKHGNTACGLLDNSQAGDWRLSNVSELFSLVSFGYHNPSLSNTNGDGHWKEGDPFTGVELYDAYWTSSNDEDGFWTVQFDFGLIMYEKELRSRYYWPVRGGQ